MAFVFGGSAKRGGDKQMFILDLENFRWKTMQCSNPDIKTMRLGHSFNKLSSEVAVLHGGIDKSEPFREEEILSDCWLLNIRKLIAQGGDCIMGRGEVKQGRGDVKRG